MRIEDVEELAVLQTIAPGEDPPNVIDYMLSKDRQRANNILKKLLEKTRTWHQE